MYSTKGTFKAKREKSLDEATAEHSEDLLQWGTGMGPNASDPETQLRRASGEQEVFAANSLLADHHFGRGISFHKVHIAPLVGNEDRVVISPFL